MKLFYSLLINQNGRVWNIQSGEIKDSNSAVNLCLDVFNNNVVSGATVGEWTCNGQVKFYFNIKIKNNIAKKKTKTKKTKKT
jgi:hypothetical protein